jgi:hypothetical protein
MKRKIINLVAALVITAMPLAAAFGAIGDPMAPPSGGPGGGGGGPIAPSPVGSGLVLLLSLGAAYGAKKVYQLRKKEE